MGIKIWDNEDNLLGCVQLSELNIAMQEERKRLELLERHSRRALRLAKGGLAALQVGNYDPLLAREQLERIVLVLGDIDP